MTKIIVILSLLLLGGAAAGAWLRFSSGEDTWICVNDEWVRHGNPANPQPETGCGTEPAAEDAVEEKNESGDRGEDAIPEETIADALGIKYNRPAADFILSTEINTGTHAKGSVRIRGENGGGLWFAVKTENGWELAHDGQGIMSCETARKYVFPTDVIPGCVNTQNGNAFIQRK